MFLFKRQNVFYLQYDVDGITKRISTKCKIKSEAMKFLMDYKNQLNNKTNPIQSVSLSEFQTIYNQFIETTFSNAYYKLYQSVMNQLISFFGDVQLNSLKLNDFQRFFHFTFKSVKSKTYYDVIKAMMKRSIEWNYYNGSNPIDKIPRPKRQQKEVLYITKTEFDLIMDKVDKEEFKVIYQLLYNTGLRRNELTTMKWNQVDLNKRLIILNNTKSKKNRVVPLNDVAFNIIKNIKRTSEFLFVDKINIPITNEQLSQVFKDAVKDADVNQEYHVHNLRSGFASNLANKNIPIQIVSKLLGHSSVQVTERFYTHIRLDSLIDAVNTI